MIMDKLPVDQRSFPQIHPLKIIGEFPILRYFHQAVLDRIGMDINAQVQQMMIVLNGFALELALK